METAQPQHPEPRRLGWFQLTLIILLAMVITAGVTLWLVKSYLFPTEFTPVSLNSEEQQTLATKLERLDAKAPAGATNDMTAEGRLQPQAYSETGASRDVRFSERELNALLANNTDLARKVAIDLSDDLVSARLLLPMDPDFPIFGGKTLRARAGVTFAYENERPIVRLQGVTVMGVPIPNAWLGGLKNVDLVSEFGNDEGFWRAFADGVAALKVEEGNLMLRLKE